MLQFSGYKYPWGDKISSSKANYDLYNRTKSSDWKMPWFHIKNVGSYAPNAYGLYDMVGNVWEWCADSYDDKHVIRGGSYRDNSTQIGCAIRWVMPPLVCNFDIGFRCAMDIR